ncbi:hypothetical protein ABL78_5989 [Leptomonas seymouri]|uniref:gamma-glutamylcyclotransferase n=1 Tax=Leptomonas seymouri TaxID=5684 RepID=A0A0N0P468_LEPSE|nr:hypothetical protein ABL78_5989 [Leptomonas seymouri]|eukprot:KPI84946.1 hypothetical protein ABL78_5989 [Leptomonas seymouri]
MTSNTIGNFYYFAYGTYVDPEVMRRALADVTDGAVPAILRSHPAILPGYRLLCDAVSAEGPRFGRLNITPYALLRRDTASAQAYHAQHESKHHCSSDHPLEDFTAFRDGVRGMLYELPANMREPLLQAVAREGSFNMYAMLTCVGLSDVRHGVRDADATVHGVLVIAALDLPLLERKYVVEESIRRQWMVLPPPKGVTIPPGLTSKAPAVAAPTDADGDCANKNRKQSNENSAAVTFRWPGMHWCNCISSRFVAPSCAYAAAIEKAYKGHLLLQTATEEDEERQEKHKGAEDNSSDYGGRSEDCASYGQAIYRMVFMRARDTAKDPSEEKTWYLAYGLNLSWEQVCALLGPPYQRRAVKLPDYVLVTNKASPDTLQRASFGCFNVEPVEIRNEKKAKGLVKHHSTMPPYVCGAAYQISMAQLEMMDRFETGSSREFLRCKDLYDAAAAPWDCWAYIAQETSEELLPSREYISRVLEGADVLPPEYVEGIRATPTNPLCSPCQEYRMSKL